MSTTVISIVLGVITIIGVIIKCFRWAVKKIQDDYQSKLEDSEFKSTLNHVNEKLTANSEGTLALLRFRLKEEMSKAIANNQTTLTEYEVTTDMFRAYKRLGGNHTVEHMYEDYQELPVRN
ncbi:hypothetical protein ACGCUP_00830 [Eubacteriales bacterium KG125]